MHRQAFREACLDGHINDAAARVGHQSTHASHLLDLRQVTLRARVRHREYSVVLGEVLLHRIGNAVGGFVPGLDRCGVFFFVSDDAFFVHPLEFGDLRATVF